MTGDLTRIKINRLLKEHMPGHSLAQGFYNDPDIYNAEIENIFLKHWIFACHVSQIPVHGDFVLCEFDKESIIVVRNGDNDINAFINVCRHRGSRICLEEKGTKKYFKCPYHAWTYDLDGALRSAGQMPSNFDFSKNGLHKVHVEIVQDLVFVSVAEEPLSLEAMKTDLEDVFDILELDNLKLAKRQSYPILSNWKLAVENYQECYHCAPAHKEYAKIHAMARTPSVFQAKRTEFKKSVPPGGLMNEANAYFDLAKVGEEGFQYDRNPLMDGMVSGSIDGSPLAPLLGKLTAYTGGASELMIGPLMYFLIYDDHVVGYRFLPVSQQECVCDVYWFVREDAEEGTDYDVQKLSWMWDVTTQSDQVIIENNQKGVDSRFYRSGQLSEMEKFLQSFLRWYVEKLSLHTDLL
jgi:Rieske 2Fe-2S family protein